MADVCGCWHKVDRIVALWPDEGPSSSAKLLMSDFDSQRQRNKKVYKQQRIKTNDTKIYLMGDVIEIKG